MRRQAEIGELYKLSDSCIVTDVKDSFPKKRLDALAYLCPAFPDRAAEAVEDHHNVGIRMKGLFHFSAFEKQLRD